MYKIISGEIDTALINPIFNELCIEFFNKTGYWPTVNGRSGGYLVMRKAYISENALTFVNTEDVCCDEEDYEEWSIDDLRERTKTVQAFDILCDEIRDTWIKLIEQCEIIEYDVVTTAKMLRIKGENNYEKKG